MPSGSSSRSFSGGCTTLRCLNRRALHYNGPERVHPKNTVTGQPDRIQSEVLDAGHVHVVSPGGKHALHNYACSALQRLSNDRMLNTPLSGRLTASLAAHVDRPAASRCMANVQLLHEVSS